MKQKHTILCLFNIRKALFLFLLSLPMLIISCKESKDKPADDVSKNDANATDMSKTKGEQSTTVAPLSGELYTLKLSKTQFDSLQKYKGEQLVFQFLFNSTDSKSPTLVAYPSKNKNKFFPNNTNSMYNPAELATGQSYMPVESKMIFGDQFMTTEAINKFLQANQIDTSDPYTIIFNPAIKASRHIYYRITVNDLKSMVSPLETNPSPPKDALQ